MAQGGQRDIGDGDIGSQSDCHKGCVATYNAGTEHQHFGRRYSGNAAKQYTFATLWLLEETRTFLYGHAACHFAHGNKQGQRMVGKTHGLVGDADAARCNHGFGELAVTGKVEVGEHHLIFFDEFVLGLDGLFDFYDHLGNVIDGFDGGKDLSAGGDVLVVAKAAAFSGSVLHIHCVSVVF